MLSGICAKQLICAYIMKFLVDQYFCFVFFTNINLLWFFEAEVYVGLLEFADSNQCYQTVPHLRTDWARHFLNPVIKRVPVFSALQHRKSDMQLFIIYIYIYLWHIVPIINNANIFRNPCFSFPDINRKLLKCQIRSWKIFFPTPKLRLVISYYNILLCILYTIQLILYILYIIHLIIIYYIII